MRCVAALSTLAVFAGAYISDDQPADDQLWDEGSSLEEDYFENDENDEDAPSSGPSMGPSQGPEVDGIDCDTYPLACDALLKVSASEAEVWVALQKLSQPADVESATKELRRASRGRIEAALRDVLTALSEPDGEKEEVELWKTLDKLEKEEEEYLEDEYDEGKDKAKDDQEEREDEAEAAVEEWEADVDEAENALEETHADDAEEDMEKLAKSLKKGRKSLKKAVKKAKKSASKAMKKQQKAALKQAKKELHEEYERFRHGDFELPGDSSPIMLAVVRSQKLGALSAMGVIGAAAFVVFRRQTPRANAALEPLLAA